MEINSDVHFLKSQICEMPFFTSGGLGLGLVTLVLVLTLKNLVLFNLHHWYRLSQSVSILAYSHMLSRSKDNKNVDKQKNNADFNEIELQRKHVGHVAGISFSFRFY